MCVSALAWEKHRYTERKEDNKACVCVYVVCMLRSSYYNSQGCAGKCSGGWRALTSTSVLHIVCLVARCQCQTCHNHWSVYESSAPKRPSQGSSNGDMWLNQLTLAGLNSNMILKVPRLARLSPQPWGRVLFLDFKFCFFLWCFLTIITILIFVGAKFEYLVWKDSKVGQGIIYQMLVLWKLSAGLQSY